MKGFFCVWVIELMGDGLLLRDECGFGDFIQQSPSDVLDDIESRNATPRIRQPHSLLTMGDNHARSFSKTHTFVTARRYQRPTFLDGATDASVSNLQAHFLLYNSTAKAYLFF